MNQNTAKKIVYLDKERRCSIETEMDIDKYESMIRQDERVKVIRQIKRKQRRARERREAALEELLYVVKQKVLGLSLIIGSIILGNSGLLYNETIQDNDWTFPIFVIIIGVLILFSKDEDEWED